MPIGCEITASNTATGTPSRACYPEVSEEAIKTLLAYRDSVREIRETLDSRYDDLKSGKVKLIDGEEAFERLRRRENDLP